MGNWALLLIAPAMLMAQQPRVGPRPWFLDAEVVRDLNLSDTQIKQIRQTQKDFRARMLDLREAANKAETDLEAAFNEDPVDQNKANEAINRLASTRGDLTRTVSQMDLKLRTILTVQQWQELQQRQRSRPGVRHRGPNQGGSTAPH
jgi:Spy/CpxP family protein refolding chaperone